MQTKNIIKIVSHFSKGLLACLKLVNEDLNLVRVQVYQ